MLEDYLCSHQIKSECVTLKSCSVTEQLGNAYI